ncbi:MAG: hypothetical protein R3D83_02515 [Caenibius sp.]
MQRPSTGELLAGLRRALTEQVLPALTRGVPQQQLKAALHLIGRLERSWDLAASHLAEDNTDIAAVLGELLPADGPQSLEARLARIEVAQPAGYNDPALATAAQRNLALHQLLLEQDDSAQIHALFARMAARDAIYVGDRAKEDGAG